MKVIWNYLKQHISIDFNVHHYGVVAVFLASCIYFNYKFDFEDSYLDLQQGFVKFLLFLLTNLFAYIVPVISYCIFYRKKVFTSREFWIKSLFAIALLSFDRCVFFIDIMTETFFHSRIQIWMGKILNNLMGILTMILPLFILYLKYDNDQKNSYGLTPKRFNVRPYFTMLALIFPLLVAASFLPSFQNQYPMYEPTRAYLQLGVPEWITVAGYEIAYALNFISIEFFFRGFLVIGMITLLGRGAIVPMACVYCFLHFGKPMGEAISSIFGGYILGVVAYETRGIWGGVIVHVGIAWLMEIIAFAQKIISADN